jgi:SulP family sulfate permease
LACAGVILSRLFAGGRWHGEWLLAGIAFALLMVLTSGLQVLPAYEYGKQAVRWINWSHPVGWDEPVPYPVHATYGLHPLSILGIVLPGIRTEVDAFLGTVLVSLLPIPVETIGSRFGGIPQGLPRFHLPELTWTNIQPLFQPAVTIALLAAIESLLSAVVADGMIDDRHDSNQELMAQGIANIACPLFGGIPATGAIARTATNIRSGARTPVAGITHALTLLVIILAAAPLAKFIPLATLSAVLMVVAYNMGEWHHFTRLAKWPKSDSAVFLATFALTVLIDLTVAVQVGMVLAAVLFIKRISETTQITAVDESTETEGPHHSLVGKRIPDGVMVYRVFGAFFFGAADKLETALKRARQDPDILILRMRKVLAMDATGLNALEDLYEKLQVKGKHLILSGPHTQPLFAMDRAGFLDRLGRENVCAHIDAALERAQEILSGKARESGPLDDSSTAVEPASSSAAAKTKA